MDKREFLKTSGVFLAGTILSPFGSGEQPSAPRTNWSGNYTYSTRDLHEPQTVAEVQQVVKREKKIRALGARHSFNGIADSTESQISLAHLNQMNLNREAGTVTVGAGVTYSELAPYLESQGFALPNLASLPHISIPGAIATANAFVPDLANAYENTGVRVQSIENMTLEEIFVANVEHSREEVEA